MAQVAEQDPSTTASKEPSISVDDSALTRPLVSEHIPPYQPLPPDSLAYPTHHIVDRSHTIIPPLLTMQSPHSLNHQTGHPSQSKRDRPRLPKSSLLQSNSSTSTQHSQPKPHSRPNPPNKPVPLSEQPPSGRVDLPQPTSSLHPETRPSAADFVANSSSPSAHQPDPTAVIGESHTLPTTNTPRSETPIANSADNTQSHFSRPNHPTNPSLDQQPPQFHHDPSDASASSLVHLDQFQPNHPVYNMVSTFREMTINPMQYAPSVPMIPIQPHPLPLSPEQAAHVAHHQQPQTCYI